jgi:hypothetical protein
MEARQPVPRSSDAVAGGVLFGLAGLLFIILCFVAGVSAFTADTAAQGPQTGQIVLVATITFWIGLPVAIAGLVIWIVRVTQHKPIVIWAVVEAAVMVVLIVLTMASGAL